MASSPENVDSRTSGIGRKRALREASQDEHENSAAVELSNEGSAHQLHKRVKPNQEEPHQSDDPPFLEQLTNADAKIPSSADSVCSPVPEMPHLPAALEKVGQPPSTWNQGVQSGLRTSFARKRNSRSQAPLVLEEGHREEQPNIPSGKEEQTMPQSGPQDQPIESLEARKSQPSSEDEMDRSTANAVVENDNVGGEVKNVLEKTKTRVLDEDDRPMSKKQSQRYRIAMKALEKRDKATGRSRPLDELRKEALAAARPAKATLVATTGSTTASPASGSGSSAAAIPVLSNVIRGFQTGGGRTSYHSTGVGSWLLREICTEKESRPIKVDELNFHLFAELFLLDNLEQVRSSLKRPNHKLFTGAFSNYLEKFLKKQTGRASIDKLREESKSASNENWLSKILKAIPREKKEVQNQNTLASRIQSANAEANAGASKESLEDRIASANSLGHMMGAKRSQSIAKARNDSMAENLASTEPLHAAVAVIVSDSGESGEIFEANGDKLSSITGTNGTTPAESGADAIDVETQVLDDAEIELQQKYFPTPRGEPVVLYRCLACASSGHTSRDCPALHCFKCGIIGSHSTLSCPQNQRCSKCRQRGHGLTECPEKLFVSEAEAPPCDLCESKDHLETACPLIWRSFDLKPEEVRRVRDIPIHCYCCGASGHYGPECGLNNSRALSGGRTWSKANWKQYVDFNSKERAISAGVDYSMLARNRKDFNIKGKANNPIDLDDSEEDEPSFIRPKINTGPQERVHIRFGGYGNNDYAPAEDVSSSRQRRYRPDPPRTTRAAPSYDSYQARDDSARYGRERTFSPPPRYNNEPRHIPQYDNPYNSNFQDQRHADERSFGHGQPSEIGSSSYGNGGRATRGGGRDRGRGGYANTAPRAPTRLKPAEERPKRVTRKSRASKGDRKAPKN